MPPLVLELQRNALNSNTSVTDLLRMALVVARKLRVKEFERWVDLELKGYPDVNEVPKYRILSGQFVARNRFRGWEAVMTHNLDSKVVEELSTFNINYPIGELECDLKKGEKPGAFLVTYTKATETMLMNAFNYPAVPAVQIQGAQFQGILDSVRTIILEWSLKLEEDGILGEGMTFSEKEKEAASSATYKIKTYINQMSHSQIQQRTKNSAQTLNTGSLDPEKIDQVIQTLKDGLDQIELEPEEKSEIEADVSTIETQMRSPKPKTVIIRESLHSIRNILEGAAGSGLATGIIHEIVRLLQ